MGHKLNILLVNDDGINAKGIQEIKKALSEKFNVYVCAPDGERSSNGHAITYTKSIKAYKIDECSWSLDGTPADCVIFGLSYAFKDIDFDLVVSGINLGANLGNDQYYSGTMGAAREAIYSDVPAISCSLATSSIFKGLDKVANFEESAQWFVDFIQKKFDTIKETRVEKVLLNLNYPNLPAGKIKGVKLTRPGTQVYEKSYVKHDDANSFWMKGGHISCTLEEGQDTKAISDHYISITTYKLIEKLSDASSKWDNLID